MEPGIQISSLRPLLTTCRQMEEAFEKLAAMGCRWVQLQWLDPGIPPEAVAAALDRYALRSVSVQDFCAAVWADPQYYITLNQRTSGRWLCLSRIPEEYKSPRGLKEFAAALKAMDRELSPLGQQVCFHPVTGDFQGVPGMDPVAYLLEALPELPLCLDLYHLNRCCADMPGYIRRHGGRICMVHFKDSRGEKLVPAGQGEVPWEGVVQACREAGVSYGFVEQETWDKDPFLCLQEALSWLNTQ